MPDLIISSLGYDLWAEPKVTIRETDMTTYILPVQCDLSAVLDKILPPRIDAAFFNCPYIPDADMGEAVVRPDDGLLLKVLQPADVIELKLTIADNAVSFEEIKDEI